MKSLKYQRAIARTEGSRSELDKLNTERSFGAKSFKKRKAARKTANASRKANRRTA